MSENSCPKCGSVWSWIGKDRKYVCQKCGKRYGSVPDKQEPPERFTCSFGELMKVEEHQQELSRKDAEVQRLRAKIRDWADRIDSNVAPRIARELKEEANREEHS